MKTLKTAISWTRCAPLALALCAGTAPAVRADDPTPSLVVTGGGPGSLLAGTSRDSSFDAVVNNPPVSNQECTITGPKWSWSASVTDGPDHNTAGSSAAVDSPTNPDDEDDSATVTFSFTRAGTYHVVVSANAHYTSSCTDGDKDVSGTKGFDVTVVDFSGGVTQSEAHPNPAKVAEEVEMKLDANLTIPTGYSLEAGPVWEWDFGTIQYRRSEDDSWSNTTPGFDAALAQSPPGAHKATYWCTFYASGQYRIQVIARCKFSVDGHEYTREFTSYVS